MTNGTDIRNKRIIITGGLGFIGSNLAHRCVEMGAIVTIYDNLDPHSGGNLYNIEDIKDKVSVHFHDLLNFDQLIDHIVDQDIIVNCAASTSHPFSMREPWIDLDVNSRSVVNLLEAVRRFNREAKFIHLGTSTQLGTLHYQPADEHHPEFPTDIYSANKSVSEKYCLVYAKAYKIRACVIRLSNIYGPRASIHSPEFTFNNYFVGLALQGKDITVFGDGQQLRNILFVDDAVEALISAMSQDASDGETYFAVGDEHFSVAEIAEQTVACLGGRVVYVPWPAKRKAIDVGDAIISNRKIKETLGWAPSYNIGKGLAKTKKYYETCMERYLG